MAKLPEEFAQFAPGNQIAPESCLKLVVTRTLVGEKWLQIFVEFVGRLAVYNRAQPSVSDVLPANIAHDHGSNAGEFVLALAEVAESNTAEPRIELHLVGGIRVLWLGIRLGRAVLVAEFWVEPLGDPGSHQLNELSILCGEDRLGFAWAWAFEDC